ncbi:MAG: hypothetical protein Q4D58_00555 [Synergistaceae bacterium]|nr:hypothetical protein [Synergistaceae bacterium]
MISLIRTGPESIALKISSHISEIRHKLAAWGILVSLDQEGALRRYGPTRRLVFLSAPGEEGVVEETYVSENSLELFLTTLINSRLAEGVSDASVMPGYLMMRLMGDIGRGIEAIIRDIGGEVIDRDPIFRPDLPGTSTVIHFTRKSLAKTIPVEDMHHKALLIHSRSKGALVQYLSIHGIEYLGDALGTPDWNDVEIRICDSDGLFDLQRQRLLTVVQGMQIGLVLEEKWEREQALTRRTIPVYMMKIYTPLAVQAIKKLAMGLEYNAQGNRFVDFDVYHEDRKISAFTELDKNPGMTRNEIGVANRNEVLKNLDIDSINELLRLEEEIAVQSRKKVGEK